MEDLAINIDNKNIIIFQNSTCRKFVGIFPKKFDIRGFGMLDARQIITNKLNLRDFQFEINLTNITLTFNIARQQIVCNYNLVLDEVFSDNLDFNVQNNNNVNDLKNIIQILKNKINNQTGQIEILNNKINELNFEIERKNRSSY